METLFEPTRVCGMEMALPGYETFQCCINTYSLFF